MYESALGRERLLERRRLERRSQLARQPERVERWQRVPLPLPFSFSAFGRSFCKQSFSPSPDHASSFFNAYSDLFKLFVRYQFCIPCYLYEEPQRVSNANGSR